jgi:hypothetical protein
MATVNSKEIVDKIIKGNGYYPGDDIRVVRIVEYTNIAGQQCYGLEYKGDGKLYYASRYVHEPKVIWEAKRS